MIWPQSSKVAEGRLTAAAQSPSLHWPVPMRSAALPCGKEAQSDSAPVAEQICPPLVAGCEPSLQQQHP